MSGVTHGENGNLIGTAERPIDPRLGPLGDYGGPTWTIPLLSDSPAIDAGEPNLADAPPTEQRGSQRIVDGDGNDTARVDMGAFEYMLGEALVFGRHVYYDASTWDDPAEGRSDDDAVAPDKVPLLPGRTATFENYTTYSRGINGIMVDLAALPEEVTPAAADFEFHTGNDNEPAGWAEVTVEPTVTLRRGAGDYGCDRVTIVFPDGAVHDTWLQVTVKAANLALSADDVFYFGNAVAETGNSSGDARVTTADLLLARNNPRDFLSPAPIDFLRLQP